MIPSSINNNMSVMVMMTTRITSLLLLFLVLWLSLAQTTHAFARCNPTRRCLPSMHFPCPLRMASNNDLNTDDEEELTPTVGEPVSRMTNFAAQFLDKVAAEESLESDGDEDDDEDLASRIAMATFDDIGEATHLVAIPLESSYELLIELESIQRAILHHCPILLDACIGGTTTRLPLLYIKAPDSFLDENPQNSAAVTNALAATVRRLVKKHIYGAATKKKPDEENDDVETNEDSSLNAEGYRPLTMTFQSLEIDGDNNNILNTVGSFSSCDADDMDEDDGEENENDEENDPNFNERRFENFIRDLQSVVAAQGWQMAFPPDPNSAENEQTGSTTSFRPRVAFMELPKSFDENISRFKSRDKEIEEKDVEFLKAEEGGNGISPIFWCNWWDDVFARNVRLQEIGIYPASVDQEESNLLRNQQFFVPFETIALPNGNEEMAKSEKKFLDYHQKRMKEKEEELEKEISDLEGSESLETSDNPLSPGSSKSSEPDVLMTKTRKRLESIYLKNAGFEDSDALIEELEGESQIDDEEDEDIVDFVGKDDKTRSKDDDYMEDWMRERIMQASNQSPKDAEGKPSNSTQSTKTSNDSDNTQKSSTNDSKTVQEDSDYMESWMKKTIENAVNNLGSMKNRNVEKKEPKYSVEDNPVFKAYKDGTLTNDMPKAPPTKELGPYPGNDHFVGIWKVVVNPMGDGGKSTTDEGSENLLLRIDGTTAAGPTLNPETNQKAAGGTWKMLPQENGEVLLRIRLVIPPEKKRILVMEGRVDRGSGLGFSMASRTFGIPLVEEKANQGDEVKIICTGEAYIEDAITKKNKIRAENFYIEKVQGGKDPDNYTITIPKTIRRLD